MASTYSPYLRLELIGTGEQTGTWGATTNTNLGTLLDQAVAGTATVDVTLGDVTLTALNGSSDQSRQAILKITGTPGAARNVIAPESSKWYLVSNDCGQTITLKGASTTGYAIADGETLLMFWDGSDFVPGSSTALGYTPVNKAGDTMSGALYLPSATPTLDTQAATKGYVDSAVSGAVGSNFVLRTGDTMTGPLVLPGAPTLSTQAATKGYVDGAISGAGYATQSWVLSQSYANTSTQSLLYYYTKTDSDSRYVSVNTQSLTYYPLTTTVAATYATISSLSGYGALNSTNTWNQVNYFGPVSGGLPLRVVGGAGQTLSIGGASANTTYSELNIYVSTSTQALAVRSTGTYNATGVYGTISDVRKKENIEPSRNYLADINKVNVVKYSLKSEKSPVPTKLGVIAQELEQIFPSLIDTGKDQDGNEEKSVKMSIFIPMLIKSVQELSAKLDAANARIAALEAK